MSLDKIQQLVSSLAKTVENNEKLATPLLSAKLTKAAASYPHDQTIGMISRVVNDMANKTVFIRKADFKDLYKRFYSNGTKFAQVFEEELGETQSDPNITTYSRDEAVKANPYHIGDQVLANALESVFDKHIPLKMYSQPLADKAVKSVGDTLSAWNLHPTKLTVSAGSDKFLVIKADYETPKGVTSFYVPVEIQDKNITEASVFMGNAGPQELNHKTIKSYLTSFTGAKLKVDATSILNVLTKSAHQGREVTDVELAATRLMAKKQGKSEFFHNQIVGQKMAEASLKDVELPKLEEANTFEEKFNSIQGLATLEFGLDNINASRSHIVRQLASFGHRNPQVVVTGHNNNTVFFGVSIDTGKAAFTVPVKIADGKVMKPGVLICNGSISTFNQAGINQLISENRLDNKVAAAASTYSALKPSEVINNLRQAMADGNHEKAEDALNVLAHSNDDKAYATGFQIYMNGLSGKKQAETKCKHTVKTAKVVSEYPICSQTGLPINKVYQDKDGNCRPLYRKGMDETYEGAVFNNAKIFG